MIRRVTTILAAGLFAASLVQPVQAADLEYERQLGLIVSGVVDTWAGVQFIDDGSNDDALFMTGSEGRLSLPLAENFSIQTDFKYEYNSNAFTDDYDLFGPRYGGQGAIHFTWRDPSSFLFGVVGGAGRSNFGALDLDYGFVGLEGQVYLNDVTLYAQGGAINYDPRNRDTSGQFDNGYFGRAVVRWFIDDASRLQLEGTYLTADFSGDYGEIDIFSAGARYDFSLTGFPVFGDLPLFVAYRGTFRDSCVGSREAGMSDVVDHAFMIGSSYSFSGGLIAVDRQGATLDTPYFTNACSYYTPGPV